MTDPIVRSRAARRPARRPLPVLRAALLGALVLAVPAAAQPGALAGRVVKDGRGVPGVPVEVHRVATGASGVVATDTSGADGAFRVALPPVDTAAGFTVFFATATADGVRYFGPALHPGDPEGAYAVQVYDTTSAAAAVDSLRVSRRDVILVPGTRGGWEVAEVVRVENPLDRTVVARGGRPVFGVRIPADATDFETARAETSTGADSTVQDLVQVGGRVMATVPLTPGGRDFFFRYRVRDAGALALASGAAVDSLAVYVRQPAEGVRVEGLTGPVPFDADGEQFLRWAGGGLGADAAVTVRQRAHGGAPVDSRLAAAVVTALVLAAGAVVALRRRPAA